MNGIINVLKPPGMTSHDVVNFIRKTLEVKKVGHTGTLDPNAAGVLPICIGKGTKISQYMIEKNKRYRGELTLGKQTDTQDKYGNIINESNKDVCLNNICEVFQKFKGEIEQLPPMYSAIKLKGKKLYELAREGKTVERDPRIVTIHDLKILKISDDQRVLFDVLCSKGTYIRTLCNDIGNELGVYGYMSFLLRTEVGVFNINNSHTIEEIRELAKLGKIERIVKSIDSPLIYYKNIFLEDRLYNNIINGNKIPFEKINLKEDELQFNDKYKVYCKKSFIGIGNFEKYEDKVFLKMEKVLL